MELAVTSRFFRAVQERIRGRVWIRCIALRRLHLRPRIARAGKQLAGIWIEHDGGRRKVAFPEQVVAALEQLVR